MGASRSRVDLNWVALPGASSPKAVKSEHCPLGRLGVKATQKVPRGCPPMPDPRAHPSVPGTSRGACTPRTRGRCAASFPGPEAGAAGISPRGGPAPPAGGAPRTETPPHRLWPALTLRHPSASRPRRRLCVSGPTAAHHALSATRAHAPCTMHHVPCTMHHAPCTMHHAPCTMYHVPCNMQHATCNMQHVPCTMHHAPSYLSFVVCRTAAKLPTNLIAPIATASEPTRAGPPS